MKHLNIRVSGRVQGVFFRASTKEQADSIGIKGFVRNETNGDVYIEAEGNEGELEEFVKWCRQGPSHARVDNLDIKEGELLGFVKFEINRWG